MNLKHYWDKLKSILGLGLSLAKANFKLRNEGSYLGILWYLLEPLLMFLIIILIRSNIGKTEIENYPIYLLIGLVVFNFFRGASILSISSIKNNAGFVKSMKIPLEALVIASVLQFVFSHVFEIIVLVIFMFFLGIAVLNILFYGFVFIFLVLFVLGVSFILACLGVYINDVTNVWNVLTRLLWFVTPIFYFVEKGSRIFLINLFNPMFYFISGARDLIIYRQIPEFYIVVGVVLGGCLFFVLGVFVFEKFKNKFAENL